MARGTRTRDEADAIQRVMRNWERACGKVEQEGMMEDLERMDVHPKLIKLTRALYQNTTFKVEMDGECSEWKKQTTGNRQGCTLSPYLFLILMTVIFHDTHDDPELEKTLEEHRPPRHDVDEVLYADDTIIYSTNTDTTQTTATEPTANQPTTNQPTTTHPTTNQTKRPNYQRANQTTSRENTAIRS